jgi:hypothetical protein
LLVVGERLSEVLQYELLAAYPSQADLLINVSGMLVDPALVENIATRVYLDLDPAFIQIWHAVVGIDMRSDRHTAHVSVGLGLGSAECRAPDCGRRWITTLQPIVLSRWPAGGEIEHNALTTVGNWRGYGSLVHEDELYGQKAHSLRELIRLPERVADIFLLALSIHSDEKADLAALRQYGWRLLDPAEVAATPASYQRFVQRSKAEFGLAKSGYVKSRCGWFSDRSVCYLASGRPVIAQDTGFSRYLKTGEGLLPFNSVDEAAACIHRMNEDYALHSKAARALAEECFASDKVLNRLLQQVGVAI